MGNTDYRKYAKPISTLNRTEDTSHIPSIMLEVDVPPRLWDDYTGSYELVQGTSVLKVTKTTRRVRIGLSQLADLWGYANYNMEALEDPYFRGLVRSSTVFVQKMTPTLMEHVQ